LQLLADIARAHCGPAAEDDQRAAAPDRGDDFARPRRSGRDASAVDPDGYPGGFQRIGDGQRPLPISSGVTQEEMTWVLFALELSGRRVHPVFYARVETYRA
jgi:hypothetical protein